MDNQDFTNEELADCLDKDIEMLFFIEEDIFDRKDVQNVVFAMKGVIHALRKGK